VQKAFLGSVGTAEVRGKLPTRVTAAAMRGGERVGGQEVSKPVLIGVVAVVVIVIGLFGWYYFGRPQTYPGFQAPQGGSRAVGNMPGQAPGMR
jgi:hypothetical protein